ncbi:MAG: cadmium-translocating P-type ATPase [Bradymonadaceae bacterium]|nr:cadmium-translocating P-type ATPase [Lujinxingiaceae bacterium]
MQTNHHDHHDHKGHLQEFRRRFFIALALTIPILILSPMLQHWAGVREQLAFEGELFVLLALSSVVYFYGGWPFLKGLARELSARNPGMMTLVAVAISTAYFYSVAVVFGLPGDELFWELSTLVTIMLLGHWIEMRSILGASRALEELVRLMPSEAHRLRDDGSVEDVALDALHPGDRILIRPGEKVPADGLVCSGRSEIDESMLTGESVPVLKGEGELVIGGSVNGEGALTVEVRKMGAESYLSQVIELVREAQQSKSRTQDLANRAAKVLTAVALGAGALTLFVWSTLVGSAFSFSIERTVTVMVIACPHALGLAVPLVVAVSTALAATNGLLIRNRVAFERARQIQAVIFDKTGTLTKGEFGVTDVLVFDQDWDEQRVLEVAASLESQSAHPIARGIAATVERHRRVDNFRSLTGRGIEGTIDGQDVKVVSPGYLSDAQRGLDDQRIEALSEQGKTVVFVLVDEQLVGAIAVADIIRPEARATIARLHALGIRTMMLTGDNARVARWVGREIGLDEVFAEVLPDQKAQHVKAVQARGLTVAMTGDGVNDAPALAQADIGIAVGAGTEVAIATADVILVRSNPEDVVNIIELSRATYRKMTQNLAWATGYNIFAIPLAAGVLAAWGVLLTPAAGAVLMSLSTVIVAINARLLRFGAPNCELPADRRLPQQTRQRRVA